MSWGLVAISAATVASGAIGSNAAKRAAKTEADATLQAQREATAAQQKALAEQRQQWAPFAMAGQEGLSEMMKLIRNPSESLSSYYRGPEYAMMQEQAGRDALASSEATGGMGSTATSNDVGSISPVLGQSFLANRMNSLNNLVNVGLNATGANASATNQAGNTLTELAFKGGINRGSALAGGQLTSGKSWGDAINTGMGTYLGGKMAGLF
ncbi:hypothetical protein [Vibrio sp. SCSIO 43136]|uniref:hypothetical protein n=1 Tax=Vibrio sp. SCSIO 43136 TaxID=2819101 RepID=UPI00207508C6|nr:hypothetical protein [Vibrio sp. SCSIO 43136]USD64208.1 hypothetical protein J4N39_08800 [Vibrio sp. SCSIO 43136]